MFHVLGLNCEPRIGLKFVSTHRDSTTENENKNLVLVLVLCASVLVLYADPKMPMVPLYICARKKGDISTNMYDVRHTRRIETNGRKIERNMEMT